MGIGTLVWSKGAWDRYGVMVMLMVGLNFETPEEHFCLLEMGGGSFAGHLNVQYVAFPIWEGGLRNVVPVVAMMEKKPQRHFKNLIPRLV